VLLTPEEGRVVGCLVEKQLTTPQQYPLTLNALVAACNQSSNREPVVDYDDRVVEAALASLRTAGLVRFLHPSHGRAVIRFGQALDERLGLDDRALGLLAVLLLRGAQTAGELRIRTERMASFEGIADVDAELVRLSGRDDPLAVRLGRRPGQKEERWAQLIAPTAGQATETHDGGSAGPPASARPVPEGRASPLQQTAVGDAAVDHAGDAAVDHAGDAAVDHAGDAAVDHAGRAVDEGDSLRTEVTALRGEVAALRGEVAAVRSEIEQLYRQLGEPVPAQHES
jgi:uncharacterized protein YceH (UPF0502 family)